MDQDVQKCGRCGEEFFEEQNLGQLKCVQYYYVYGKQFKVRADHFPINRLMSKFSDKLSTREMMKKWPEWTFTENDYIEIPKNRIKYYPKIKKECILELNQRQLVKELQRPIHGTNSMREFSIYSAKYDRMSSNYSLLELYKMENDFETDSEGSSYSESDSDDSFDSDLEEQRIGGNEDYTPYTSYVSAISVIHIYRMDILAHRNVVYNLIPALKKQKEREAHRKENIIKIAPLEEPSYIKDLHVHIGKERGMHESDYNSKSFIKYIDPLRVQYKKIRKEHRQKRLARN